MSLTGRGLPLLLGVLVVVTVSLVVWTWPRLAPTRVLTVLGRLGLLLLVNVSVLLLVFALVNDQFQFFSDWSDLTGAASTQASTTRAGGAAGSAANTPVVAPRVAGPASSSTLVSSAGRDTVYTVAGGASGVSSSVLVELPPGYADPANVAHRYPVLLGFGGYPSTVTQLATGFHVSDTLASMQSQHRLAATIAVFVQPWTPPGRDTECVNGPGGATIGDQVATWAGVDVPAWLRTHFRTAEVRSSWATWGISAGAYCASAVAMAHPETFSAAISLAGYFRPEWGNWHPFAAGDPRAQPYDLVALSSARPPPIALWLFASQADALAYPAAVELMAAARSPLSVTSQIASTGGHRYTAWTPWFPVALSWLARTARGFSP
jgi:hypothetical protein